LFSCRLLARFDIEDGDRMRLFVGDDWAEDHHDVEVMDEAGRVLARKRLPEGVAGMARLHELNGEHLGGDGQDVEVVIGIETDRGPWVAALVAAGYTVYAVTRTCWPTWCGPIRTSSGQWRATVRRPARSRWWHVPIRR
jgi:hypothetical protein